MSLLSWIVIGLLAASLGGIVSGRRVGILIKIAVGEAGALIGGVLTRATA